MPETSNNSTKTLFAIKTALSLTLAYMLPMALGWPQPQTAAITVMLIAATGMVSESLHKGVLRILGTVVGAALGLSLIALFPQDRMLYLFFVSLVVATLLYLYNAYQGDSTVFMLAAVVVMMVFNGGDAEGAFLYGIDRTLLTAFGVMIYTLVASLLWPVKIQNNTQALAASVVKVHGQAFAKLELEGEREPDIVDDILAKNEAFQTHFVSVRNDAEALVAYKAEWDTIASCFEQLDELLVPALYTNTLATASYTKHIANYNAVVNNIELMFEEIQTNWDRPFERRELSLLKLDYDTDNLHDENHLTVAAVVSRAHLLIKLQQVLLRLWQAENSLLFDEPGFSAIEEFRGKPSFIWLDRENFKTAIRVFVSFWLAVAVWIFFNPPGGFMFVTLSTAFVVLVSYTPVPPKLLYFLFTLGFLFAVPAYLFLLPQLDHWLELAAFLFAYAFIGFYVFAGPVSIFFLMGLMTLGIQNTMNYNFNVILILMLLFYMVCTSLVISVYFPFTSKPHLLYSSFRRRYFNTCEKIIARKFGDGGFIGTSILRTRLSIATSLTAKMHEWGGRIDSEYFLANSAERISNFNLACTILLEQLKIRARHDSVFRRNTLIVRAQNSVDTSFLSKLCHNLACPTAKRATASAFAGVGDKISDIESHMDVFLGRDYLETYSTNELAEFYLFVNLQASTLAAIVQCRQTAEELDWNQLREPKF